MSPPASWSPMRSADAQAWREVAETLADYATDYLVVSRGHDWNALIAWVEQMIAGELDAVETTGVPNKVETQPNDTGTARLSFRHLHEVKYHTPKFKVDICQFCCSWACFLPTPLTMKQPTSHVVNLSKEGIHRHSAIRISQ